MCSFSRRLSTLSMISASVVASTPPSLCLMKGISYLKTNNYIKKVYGFLLKSLNKVERIYITRASWRAAPHPLACASHRFLLCYAQLFPQLLFTLFWIILVLNFLKKHSLCSIQVKKTFIIKHKFSLSYFSSFRPKLLENFQFQFCFQSDSISN